MASTSFIYPATVRENVEKLTGILPEIGICMFETEACLAYTDHDLPKEMDEIPVKYHVHLPVDHKWESAFDKTLTDMLRLMGKCAFFSPLCWVLHPPPEAGHFEKIRKALESEGINPADVLLENIAGHDLTGIWNAALDNGFSACLDIGHILAYGQEKTLDLPGIWEHTRMVHAYAPGKNGRHTALNNLNDNGLMLFKTMLNTMPAHCTLNLEVFSEQDLIDSMDFLNNMMHGEHA